ncbi:Hypothetical predicted protein [Octopus vulgaris]|uniref:Reverse transcriptase domain-containing protein n=1 Tax=Octopus vulgaris TaxID=6645 RepID=A0AA36F737_OCTVU|nr:Hypothetical predicted protein [Octopus vulgaris]
MCFIDYSKALDSIDHDKLWKCLEEMGTPLHLVQLIRSLYQNQEATVRTPYGDTDWFEIGKGTRQGCILSPAAFNMYAEKFMRNAGLEDSSIGVRIGGRNINLRYADDTTLLAESGKDLEDLVLLAKKENEKFGLYLNVKKTKIMSATATKNISIKIDNEEIEVVDDFIFLDSKINRDAGIDLTGSLFLYSVVLGGGLKCRKDWTNNFDFFSVKCGAVMFSVFVQSL